MKSYKVVLLIGGNEPNSLDLLIDALQIIDTEVGKIITTSSLYQTAAWGPIPQSDFLNAAVLLRTTFPPQLLLFKLLNIETRLGRKRTVKYGPRTLDIDVLFYGNEIINSKTLKIPHPEIANRRFVLMPCCEMIPQFKHPVLNQSMLQLLEKCKDQLEVKLWNRN